MCVVCELTFSETNVKLVVALSIGLFCGLTVSYWHLFFHHHIISDQLRKRQTIFKKRKEKENVYDSSK